MDIEQTIEKIKRQITIGECEKNIGIPVYISDLKTVLNELEKKNKEIARLGKTANEYKKAIQCEKCNCSVCEAHINTLELRAELEKKDKVINEMAKYIDEIIVDKLFCGEKTMCDENCTKCIKEYFTKKVDGE